MGMFLEESFDWFRANIKWDFVPDFNSIERNESLFIVICLLGNVLCVKWNVMNKQKRVYGVGWKIGLGRDTTNDSGLAGPCF